jgi:hypothetical protein
MVGSRIDHELQEPPHDESEAQIDVRGQEKENKGKKAENFPPCGEARLRDEALTLGYVEKVESALKEIEVHDEQRDRRVNEKVRHAVVVFRCPKSPRRLTIT